MLALHGPAATFTPFGTGNSCEEAAFVPLGLPVTISWKKSGLFSLQVGKGRNLKKGFPSLTND